MNKKKLESRFYDDSRSLLLHMADELSILSQMTRHVSKCIRLVYYASF